MLHIHLHLPSKVTKPIGVVLIILFIIVGLTMIYKAQHFKSLRFSKGSVTIEYYDIPKSYRIQQQPVVSVVPSSFNLSYPNPASPSSLHGTFIVNIQNAGTVKALISDIKWKIIDGDRPITPPNEWRKIIGKPKIGVFYLASFRGMRYIYGPEIGASGKNKILLAVEVKYRNPLDKSDAIHTAYYSGYLNYDKNIKMKYSGDEFVSVARSSHEEN